MSRIAKQLLENVAWLGDLSTIMTLFFAIIFIVIVIQVLRINKDKVIEYKNMPLSDQEPEERNP